VEGRGEERLFWNFSPEKSGRKLITSYRRKEEPCFRAAPYQGAQKVTSLCRHREKEHNVGEVEIIIDN